MKKFLKWADQLDILGRHEDADLILSFAANPSPSATLLTTLSELVNSIFDLALAVHTKEDHKPGLDFNLEQLKTQKMMFNESITHVMRAHLKNNKVSSAQDNNFKRARNVYAAAYEVYIKPLIATHPDISSLAEQIGTTFIEFYRLEESSSSTNLMKEIQTLINEKAGREAVKVNGLLNDKLTYEMVEHLWGLKAGKDYKTFKQLLFFLNKENPTVSSKSTVASQKPIESLLVLANKLDLNGLHKEADEVFAAIKTLKKKVMMPLD
jgi:hypothetical protein